ncbi:hypothetical protein LJK88_28810 [Paenibacillus sp. P26]|nr:hypothetical protein LJK88_28810 [Paenibacillus sp. P26]
MVLGPLRVQMAQQRPLNPGERGLLLVEYVGPEEPVDGLHIGDELL